MDILPIKVLTDSDSPIFGNLNVTLGKLGRSGIPVSKGVCVTAPDLHLKTTLEHYDFQSKEIFEQTLQLVKKEIEKTPVPELLLRELKGHKKFWILGVEFKKIRNVWLHLLNIWLNELKGRIWRDGFYKGITEGLRPQTVLFVSKVEGCGTGFYDSILDDVTLHVESGKIHPRDQKKIVELIQTANKKIFISHAYGWIIDRGIKLTQVLPHIPSVLPVIQSTSQPRKDQPCEAKCAMKVIVDLSNGLIIETGTDGAFLSSEKFAGFDNLVLKLFETGVAFEPKPVYFKLADVTDGMGSVRGTLRLLHQESLRVPVFDAIIFALHKKGLLNINLVLPFSRNVSEILQLKRELAVKKLGRKNSLKHWFEICVPENILNLEDYLLTGLDGVIINLDEMLSHISGFDLACEELGFYKKEISSLIKFLEDPFKLLHKAKMPIIAYGSLALQHEILEFLTEKGGYGVVQKADSYSAKDLLYTMEKRVILRKSS